MRCVVVVTAHWVPGAKVLVIFAVKREQVSFAKDCSWPLRRDRTERAVSKAMAT